MPREGRVGGRETGEARTSRESQEDCTLRWPVATCQPLTLLRGELAQELEKLTVKSTVRSTIKSKSKVATATSASQVMWRHAKLVRK